MRVKHNNLSSAFLVLDFYFHFSTQINITPLIIIFLIFLTNYDVTCVEDSPTHIAESYQRH